MTSQHVRRTLLAAAATIAFALAQASAAANPSPKDEIDHLLNFVAASSCTFIRNGTEYPSDKARDHLASKYQVAGREVRRERLQLAHVAAIESRRPRSSSSISPLKAACRASSIT